MGSTTDIQIGVLHKQDIANYFYRRLTSTCMSRVMCHMSRVMCHMSHVMSHMSRVLGLFGGGGGGQLREAGLLKVCY